MIAHIFCSLVFDVSQLKFQPLGFAVDNTHIVNFEDHTFDSQF